MTMSRTRVGVRAFGVTAATVAVAAMCIFAACPAQGGDEIPTWRSLIFPAYFPKLGQNDMGAWQVTAIRNIFESYYEGWWREDSYYAANQSNGITVRGVFMDTRTYGECAMQWPFGTGAGAATTVTEVVGMTDPNTTTYSGTLSQIPYTVNGVKFTMGALTVSDTTGSGVLSGSGNGFFYYNNGQWSFTLSSQPGGYPIVATYSVFVAGSGINHPAGWINLNPLAGRTRRPGWRGEHNFEVDSAGKPVELHIHAPESGRGPSPLLDGYWTPGERFRDAPPAADVPPNTFYDVELADEDLWQSDNILTATNRRTGSMLVSSARFLQQTNAVIWDNQRGEFYADFDYDTKVNNNTTRVTHVGFSTNVEIWIADRSGGTNVRFNVSEFDLSIPPYFNTTLGTDGLYRTKAFYSTPDQIVATREGDFVHTAVTGRPGLAVTVQTNGLFDYNISGVHLGPLVYPAYMNGMEGTSRVFLAYESYLEVPYVWRQYVDNDTLPPETPVYYTGTNAFTRQKYVCIVPVYQAGEIWGQLYASRPTDIFNNTQDINVYIDAVPSPSDDRWTPGVPAESYEDFVSWWDPTGGLSGNGAWVDAVMGSPRGNLGLAPDSILKSMPNCPISWQEYVSYITDNYPGDTASVIARSANAGYNGADGWVDVANNKMQQSGFIVGMTPPSTPPPGLYPVSGWDFYNLYGGSYATWWTNPVAFGAYSASAPGWETRIPNVAPWPGNPPASNTFTVVSNYVGGALIVTRNYASIFYPPVNSTWGYDCPREFADLASSMYHYEVFGMTGGDWRFAEMTSPWSLSLYGQDRGYNDPGRANAGNPDYVIPAAGPLAYDIHATHGLDAGNLLNLEWLTWRTDRQYLTGPFSVIPACGCQPVPYQGDHRDLNLDGLIDQGEVPPYNSNNYFCDADLITPDNGMDTLPLWGWERFMEDVVEQMDSAEDFLAVQRNNSQNTTEIQIQAPSWFTWGDGTPHTAHITGLAWKSNFPPHQVFNPNIDGLWVDTFVNNRYDRELVLNRGSTNYPALTNGATGAAFPANRVLYFDRNGNGSYDYDIDTAWYDADAGLDFDTELVLSDAASGLYPNKQGLLINWTQPGVQVYYQDVNVSGAPDAGDNFWVEGRFTNTVVTGRFDSVSDNIIYTGTGAALTNGAPGVGPLANVRYYHRMPGSDSGWVNGDEVWVDANANSRYDGEEIITAPLGLAFNPLLYGVGAVANVAYRDNTVAGYQRIYDSVWVENTGLVNARYDQELVLVNRGLTNNAAGYSMPWPVSWLDTPGTNGVADGVFTPLYHEGEGEHGDVVYGDILWVDGNTNGVYDSSRAYSVPLYGVGLYNAAGAAAPGIYHSGNFFGTWTRDYCAVGGWNQVQPALMLSVLTHEQCHDVLGWPDLYDYDRYDGEYQNFPVGAFDLMASGGLVHSYPDMKFSFPGFKVVNLTNLLVSANAGPKTVMMWPCERYDEQYYYWQNPKNPGEYFWFCFQEGNSPYSTMGKGVYIYHTDSGTPFGHPLQQRLNNRFTWTVVQADGQTHLQDGINAGEAADVWPGSNGTMKVFSENTVPAARWWSGEEAGIRMTDIIMTTNAWQPCQVVFEWYALGSSQIFWTDVGADTDGDGIPDPWEQNFFSDYPNPLSECTATSDWDQDGLPDYAEWLAHLNPKDAYSWTNGVTTITDADADLDGDQLSNLEEYSIYHTNMREPDTDDDGVSDTAEMNPLVVKADGRRITSPTEARAPYIPRAMVMNGTGRTVPTGELVDGLDRFNLGTWSVECWVRLATVNETGNLVLHTINATGQTNFALRVDSNVPTVMFTGGAGLTVMATAPSALPANTWVHLAGVFDDARDTLTLYINGLSAMSQQTLNVPARGLGTTTIGSGVNGYLDELRVWSTARSATDVADWFASTIRGQIDKSSTNQTLAVAATGNANTLWNAFFKDSMPAGITSFSVAFTGAPAGAGTFTGFPVLPNNSPVPSDGIVLSSGSAAQAGGTSNTQAGLTTTLGSGGDATLTAMLGGGNQTFDATGLTISFISDSTISGVSFQLLFASEEFPEFVGDFNDAFGAFLDGQNISFDNNGAPVTVNNNYFELDNDPWNPNDPDSIGKTQVSLPFEFDGLTPLLVTSKKLDPGAHTLKFVVADTRDSILDSAIFLSNFKFSLAGEEGTVKVTSSKDLVAYYTFDDGVNTTVTNRIDGAVHPFGAEDEVHHNNWKYSILNVPFTSATAADLDDRLSDTDGDGMPDWWEDLFFDGEAEPGDDPDGDGLSNLYEYYCDTNPRDIDSDNDGIPDGEEDFDGDSLADVFEQVYGCLPIYADTDDDGISDVNEVLTGTDPGDPLSPMRDRVIQLDGLTTSYVELPLDLRFARPNWTVQAWVRPAAIGACEVISRTTQPGITNFVLGITAAGRPYTAFISADGATNTMVTAPVSKTLTVGTWYHLASTYSSTGRVLSLLVNCQVVADTNATRNPAVGGVGPISAVVGRGFNGMMDDVAVFSTARSLNKIQLTTNGMANLTDTTLISHLRFDDGTTATSGGAGNPWLSTSGKTGLNRGQVQDFGKGVGDDWLNQWRRSGTLVGGATIVTAPTNAPVQESLKDSDGDGMPDWWELSKGLNPLSSLGDNGGTGDPDLDGLPNIAEYLAGTNPFDFDTDNDGMSDYDSRRSVTNLTFGEVYTDRDGMSDTWELQYPSILSPLVYDADEDPDNDGWSTYSEFLAGTDPSLMTSYPRPWLRANVRYDGTRPISTIRVHVYNKASMDGLPSAVFAAQNGGVFGVTGEAAGTTVAGGGQSGTLANSPVVPGSVTIVVGGGQFTDNSLGQLVGTVAGSSGTINYGTGGFTMTYTAPPPAGTPMVATYNYYGNGGLAFPIMLDMTNSVFGYLREGDAWMMAFMDLNNNNNLDAGEPASVLPKKVRIGGIGPVEVDFGLTDKLPGYGRLAWAPINDAPYYDVSIRHVQSGNIMFTRRVYSVVGQTLTGTRTYIHEGDQWLAGLTTGLPTTSLTPVYEWFVDNVSRGYFTNKWSDSMSKPTSQSPYGGQLVLARNEFTWMSDSTNTTCQIQIMAGTPSSTPVLDWTATSPYRDGTGKFRYRLPYFAGEAPLTNGLYYWRVRMVSPYTSSPWSDTAPFSVNLQDTYPNTYSIAGTVYYFGKVPISSSNRVVVQAFISDGFNSDPVAQVTMTNAATFRMLGLPAGSYTVRAFIDQDGDRQLGATESFGFLKDTSSEFATDYKPARVVVPLNLTGAKIVIRDRDTDDDRLPDAWEVNYYGSITNAGVGGTMLGTPASTDSDGDGLTDWQEYLVGSNPASNDTDGDGVPDGTEVTIGLSVFTTDSDGDGTSDLMEIAAGSNPLNPASETTIAISSITFDGSGNPVITFTEHSNVYGISIRFYLEASSDLTTWTQVATWLSNGTTTAPVSLTDTTALGNSVFYRLRFRIE